MSAIKVIRYRTNPQDANENARLIRDVFAELAAEQPGGLLGRQFGEDVTDQARVLVGVLRIGPVTDDLDR